MKKLFALAVLAFSIGAQAYDDFDQTVILQGQAPAGATFELRMNYVSFKANSIAFGLNGIALGNSHVKTKKQVTVGADGKFTFVLTNRGQGTQYTIQEAQLILVTPNEEINALSFGRRAGYEKTVPFADEISKVVIDTQVASAMKRTVYDIQGQELEPFYYYQTSTVSGKKLGVAGIPAQDGITTMNVTFEIK